MTRFLRALVVSAAATAAAYAATMAIQSRRSAREMRRLGADESAPRSIEETMTAEETGMLVEELARQV